MNRILSAKPLLAAAIVVGAMAVGSAAQARPDVHVSIGLGAPYEYVQPAPVYVQPQPVYVQPAPVYVHPRPVYHEPHYRYERRGPWGDRDGDGVPNVYDRDSRYYEGRAHRDHRWRDADRDGVPNRFDRAPHNPHWR